MPLVLSCHRFLRAVSLLSLLYPAQGRWCRHGPKCFLQSEGRYSLTVEMNMMMNPMNMGMWYPILERETRGTVSGRIPRPAAELVSLRAGEHVLDMGCAHECSLGGHPVSWCSRMIL